MNGEAIPFADLDRAIAPLRRTVRFALTPAGQEQVRFFGRIARRHLERARVLDLPKALRAFVDEIDDALRAFDEKEGDERKDTLHRLFATIGRLDAVAGLPLRERIEEPRRGGEEEKEGEEREREREREEEEEAEEDEEEEAIDDWSVGIGEIAPEMAEQLAAAGVGTLRDLALRKPVEVEVLTPVHGAGPQLPVGRVAVGARLQGGYSVLHPGGGRERRSRAVGAGSIVVRWADGASAPFLGRDTRVTLAGTFDGSTLHDAEPIAPDGDAIRVPRWTIPGVDDRRLRALWAEIGSSHPHLAAAQLRGSEEARRRLAAEEALLLHLGASLVRAASVRERGVAHAITSTFAARATSVGVMLDDAQQLVFEEIKRELRRSTTMRRVVTGEVGAGNGAIALLAAATVADARAQVLVLAPDALEAEERFVNSGPLLSQGGFVSELLVSPPPRAVRDAIKRGEIHILFGTPELLDTGLEYRRLGLVIAVEREPWGAVSVRHRSLPAPRPDLLVTPSVPVGARLLLTAYADHQVSVVVDPRRRPARIELCPAAERETAYARVREAVARGEQGLVVFPLVDHKDAVEVPEAVRLVRALEDDALSGVRVGLLHGAMPREERIRIIEDFQHLRLQVLVCTTRIENGPRLPGATIAVIEQADRFDQFRLHRIIGFLSRARSPASAVLVVGELAEPDAAARIRRVLDAPNGFRLTEELVALRGVDVAVARGSAPLPSIAWLDPEADLDLLIAARQDADRILGSDPGLKSGAHRALARELEARWDKLWIEKTEEWVCPIKDLPAPHPDPKRRRRRRRRRR